MTKATGWLIVGVGGLLIAANETYALTEDLNWSIIVFWVLVVVMPLTAVWITADPLQRRSARRRPGNRRTTRLLNRLR